MQTDAINVAPSVPAGDLTWLPTYLVGKLRRFENRFHHRRTSVLSKYACPPSAAVAAVTGCSMERSNELQAEFADVIKELKAFMPRPGTADLQFSYVLFAIARLLAPRVVVETGVWHGVSSFAILKGMQADRSSRGQLVSVDLPPLYRRNRVPVGAAVPADLRDQWTLHLGPSLRILPKLLKDLGEISIFIHDSDHSYRTMLSEFRLAWRRLQRSGILISDDVHENDAFLQFTEEVGREPMVIARDKGGYAGILVK